MLALSSNNLLNDAPCIRSVFRVVHDPLHRASRDNRTISRNRSVRLPYHDWLIEELILV